MYNLDVDTSAQFSCSSSGQTEWPVSVAFFPLISDSALRGIPGLSVLPSCAFWHGAHFLFRLLNKGTIMFGLGYGEILIFGLIVLVLFGGSRIPTLARSLGKSITEFKKGVAGIDEEQPASEKEPNKQA